MDVFRVRLNCIDHYQAAPTKYDPRLGNQPKTAKFSKEPKVPVIRVFGSTETGQKVCAHIHGAFPYLFIEYDGSLEPEQVEAYSSRLHLSIDHAVAVSYRQDPRREQPRFVARITLAKAIPFYGFHVGYRFYLKIYVFNPIVTNRLADLLQQGMIMNRKFQPYEAHIQYLQQFMVDYNLYGCNYIEARRTNFRAPVPSYDEMGDSRHAWHSLSIAHDRITEDYKLPRVSHCSLEVDIGIQDILNRRRVKERRLHHDFAERNNPLPPEIKLVPSMAGLWKDETKRRKKKMGNASPGSSPFPRDVLVSMSADPRDSQPEGWLHEEEYREEVTRLSMQEEMSSDRADFSFDNWVSPIPLEETVQTVSQSVEDMFPRNLARHLSRESKTSADLDPYSSIEVDETGIESFRQEQDGEGDEDFFSSDSDEVELVRELEVAEEKAVKERESLRRIPNTLRTANGRTLDAPAAHSHAPHPLGRGRPLSINGFQAMVDNDPRKVFGGLMASGLRSQLPPKYPVRRELIKDAMTKRLYSERPYDDDVTSTLPVSGQIPQKRPVSMLGYDEATSKRAKFSLQQDDAEVGSPPTSASGDEWIPPSAQKPGLSKDELSRPPPASQTKQKHVQLLPDTEKQKARRDGKQSLNFSVVKDPYDTSTMLRLSQQSSSQQSDDGGWSKMAGFNPSFSSPGLSRAHPGSNRSLLDSSLSMPHSSGSGSGEPADVSDATAVMYVLEHAPPSAEEVCATMQEFDVPDAIYQEAHFSKGKDVPARKREYAGKEFRLQGIDLPYLPEFDPTGQSPATRGVKGASAPDKAEMTRQYERRQRECTIRSWEIAEPPPTFDEVDEWWEARQEGKPSRDTHQRPTLAQASQNLKPWLSQIEASTPKNAHGFKYSQKQQSTSVEHEAQYMSTMSLEIHINTRGKLFPNPEEDEIKCLFWCIRSDAPAEPSSQSGSDNTQTGLIVLSEDGVLAQKIRRQTTVEVLEEFSELDVLVRIVEVVRNLDPDVLTGYEVHGSSWGYLIERARLKYDYNLCDEFSRMKSQSHGRIGKEADRWGFNTTSTIRVTGRHMINVWRAMRGELNLLQYTMENVVWHLLHRRIPHYSWQTLTTWFNNGRPRDLAKVLRYYLLRSQLDIEILGTNELIPRTSEQARLLGVDFFSVFSRGSQFKVESIMFRLAKPENFMLASPSRKQVGGQNALECLPLVMEPHSALYTSPVVVLDFQSLYPSVMIAYNYCYSTFLGRIVNWRGTNKMGFTEYKRQQGLLRLLRDHINIAPNGMMYVKSQIRRSLLAKMLSEILETRVMVKSGMKQDKDDKALQQLLNNRQLALKLLANVTYGYTSASFSGRMPCSEIADSIVQTARETLERAIACIHSVERWGAEVVYGDTDSLFIHFRGRTRAQAFEIGAEIAKAITDMNPRPVKLKFEKVYHPCVLLTKKRYVGYKYESPDQEKPEFDAKGIETVRRDGTPAEQMIEEKALKILFETADLSRVKSYFRAQCDKIMRGRVSIQDFCFAKEVRLGTYSNKGPPPPGAMISTKRMLEDARAEPQYGERVPYVVVSGAPGARLIDRCIAPEELLHSSHLVLDSEYYITKNIIPPLERIFNLVGANVRQWYDEMRKVQPIRRIEVSSAPGPKARRTLESYMQSASCVVCGVKIKNFTGNGTGPTMCRRCRRNSGRTMIRLQKRLNAEEKKLMEVVNVCQSCAGLTPLDEVACDSKDCPVFYTRVKQEAKTRTERSIAMPLIRRLESLDW